MTSVDALVHTLTPAERQLVRSLTTPFKIQAFLDSVPYSGEERYRGPLSFLRERTGHCFDGAVFAAAMLSRLGQLPLIVDLLPNSRDDDHLLAIYKKDGGWGAMAKSNFSGLRFREPVYRSLRELVMSYFDDYFNNAGEKTLRGYTAPLNLKAFVRPNWLIEDAAMDKIADRLDRIKKYKVLSTGLIRSLSRVDERSLQAGLLGVNADGLFKPPPH